MATTSGIADRTFSGHVLDIDSRYEAHVSRPARSMSVPKAMQAAYDTVTALTDAFCGERLNEEYRDMARSMTAALCRKRPSPLVSGQPKTWACGVVYLLGQINFLSDKASEPCLTMAEVYTAFGVSQSTASSKARIISDNLKVGMMDPAWTLSSLMDLNPLVWLVSLDGVLVDLREMPRELQVMAHEQGIIPYVPADRQ